MRRTRTILLKFVVALLVTTLINAVVWEYTAHAWLYDCTDPLFLDYCFPGSWVHQWNDLPIRMVPQIVHDRPMGEPDAIKAGWSTARLWMLWSTFFASSFGLSVMLARLPWHRQQRAPHAPLPSVA